VLPGTTRMQSRIARLGYVEVTLNASSLWGDPLDRCRGHEFHYSTLTLDESRAQDWQRVYSVQYRKGQSAVEGYQRGHVLASYVHLHLPSRPKQLNHLLRRFAAQ
jgi:cobyrinic acid a,c-diamide synthase